MIRRECPGIEKSIDRSTALLASSTCDKDRSLCESRGHFINIGNLVLELLLRKAEPSVKRVLFYQQVSYQLLSLILSVRFDWWYLSVMG